MPSMNLDLPQETLDEVSRLAQELNVHRVDIFVKAVSKLAQSFAVERDLGLARDQLAEANRRSASLESQLEQGREAAAGLERELEDARGRAAAATQAKASVLKEMSALRQTATRMADEHGTLKRRHDAVVAQAQELEERDRKKVLAVMRDQEVEKVRRYAQEMALKTQELEKELTYQRMESDLKAKKLENISQRLSVATRMKKRFETAFTKQQKESFRSERQIGRLMQQRAKLRAELNQLAKVLNRPTKKRSSR